MVIWSITWLRITKMLKDPAAILVDIVRNYMVLTNDQIWQYNNKKIEPNNTSLFVVVHYLGSKPYSTNSEFELDQTQDPPVGIETTFVQTMEFFRIEICSADRVAQARKEEIAAAMSASYSQNQQLLYGFKIFSVSENFMNVSIKDGGSMLNRFMIDVSLMAWKSFTRNVDYYDNFSYELIPDRSLGFLLLDDGFFLLTDDGGKFIL